MDFFGSVPRLLPTIPIVPRDAGAPGDPADDPADAEICVPDGSAGTLADSGAEEPCCGTAEGVGDAAGFSLHTKGDKCPPAGASPDFSAGPGPAASQPAEGSTAQGWPPRGASPPTDPALLAAAAAAAGLLAAAAWLGRC